jgi:Flp pilus assembly protein TadG
MIRLGILRHLRRNQQGSTAAEFALLLPLTLLFLLGMIDVGRYMWEVNRAEKATQIGARWAAATNIIARDLTTYNFAGTGGLASGDAVPKASFPGVSCTKSGTSDPTCRCATGGTCSFGLTADETAFNLLVTRMQEIKPDIAANQVTVDYGYSGIGFAGDPTGADVSPLVTVRLQNMTFTPMLLVLFSTSVGLPDFNYTITAEDLRGTQSN